MDINADERGIHSLSDGFKNLASNIRATGTILAASSIPFAIAAIGAGIPTVAALGASFSGLALNLGKAAVGFSLVAGAAAGGAFAGLKAYSALIGRVLEDSRKLWEENNEKAVEALEKQRSEILSNADGFEGWNAELNESILRLTRLQAAVGSEVFPRFTDELDAWNKIISEFTPQIARTAGRVAEVAVAFGRWFRTAEDGQVLAQTLDFINSSAVKGAEALSLIAQIGISGFQPLIPLASRFQDTLVGVLDATNEWVSSAEGQRRLGEIYRSLWRDAKQLVPVVEDLAIGTFNLFAALDRTGIADQASAGFRSLAASFAQSTRAGGGLDRFLRGARDLMPYVADAAKAVGGALLGIASAAIGAKTEGGKLTILQGIFRGISQAAKPLENLVTGTFRQLGPVIGKLIPTVSEFLSTFAGSTGPLVVFLETINSALKAFNRLPEPIKTTAAQLVALKVILGGLGIGALIRPIGRFASNMFIAGAAARSLGAKGALPGVVGSLARLGTLLAGGIGLGILAAGLFRAYQKNEDFRKSVDRLGNKAGEAFDKVTKGVRQKVLPALTDLADKGANAIIDIFDLDGGKKEQVNNKGVFAVKQFGLGMKSEAKRQSDPGGPMAEIGGKLGAAIARGLNNWAKGGGGKGGEGQQGGIAGFFNTLNKRAQTGGENFRKEFLKELNATNWQATGKRIRTEIGKGLKGTGEYQSVKDFINNIKERIKKGDWSGVGRHISITMLEALTGVNLQPLEKWGDNLAKKMRDQREKFKQSGANAALGWLEGFKSGSISQGVVGVLQNAYEAFRNKQEEKSPSKLWGRSGRNAALGWLENFRETMASGRRQIERSLAGTLKVAQSTPRGREAIQAARSASSPGGKQITAQEMRAIMREANASQGRGIYAAAVAAGLDPRVLRLLDSMIARDFNFRNGMGAAPN